MHKCILDYSVNTMQSFLPSCLFAASVCFAYFAYLLMPFLRYSTEVFYIKLHSRKKTIVDWIWN